MTTIGSLCSGYAGLDLAAEAVTGGDTVWHCEWDDAPSVLLAARFPGVPNYRDLTTLAWADEPVDVLTAGYPCQPFSGAGKRLGIDDPRHLFPYIAQGVERLRPELLLLENVRGHLTLGFDVVLAELDRIGYDVRWTLLRAADVGAPHGRSRLWIAARDRQRGGWSAPAGEPTAVAEDAAWVSPHGGLFGSIPAVTPGTAGTMVDGLRWDGAAAVVPRPPLVLLKTPTSQLAINGGSQHPDKRKAGGHGPTLADEVEHLLPTPTSRDWKDGAYCENVEENALLGRVAWRLAPNAAWGPYAAAVAYWEALTRPAPAPTEQGKSGLRLSPAFVEWMQGLPAGWVTGTDLGLTRNAQLKLLGNGVVPIQAQAAFGLLLADWLAARQVAA